MLSAAARAPARNATIFTVITADFLDPAPPGSPRFDATQHTWILSRYADVAAALRDTHLWPAGGKRDNQYEVRDETGKLRVRPAMLEALSAARLAEWQPRFEGLAEAAFDGLTAGCPVEILTGFAKPWCLSVAMLVTGAPSDERGRLAELGDRVFAATGASDDSPLRGPAAAATAELERFFAEGPIPMGEPTFIALSQTTARLLTNAWLALFQHPAEYARLRAQPQLMPGAVDELMRYAGIVRRIYRRATADVRLGGVTIAEGQRVALMLASANRDPEAFPDPDRLNLTRPFGGHLALGAGRNSCVGAAAIRVALSVATGALMRRFDEVEVSPVGQWHTGSGFCFPAAVHVIFRANP
jgi:cytochrome P450